MATRETEEDHFLYLREEIRSVHNFEEIVGASQRLLGSKKSLWSRDRRDRPDHGRDGTGQELIARAIHSTSPRHDKDRRAPHRSDETS
jgi:transcriptional regulator with GAF, ATPase, and Fis domain